MSLLFLRAKIRKGSLRGGRSYCASVLERPNHGPSVFSPQRVPKAARKTNPMISYLFRCRKKIINTSSCVRCASAISTFIAFLVRVPQVGALWIQVGVFR
jgi:hypothetical protein